MDFSILIGSIQLAVAAFQLKLDHYSKSSNRQKTNDKEQFYQLGEAIRLLEYALSETVAFVGQTNNREPNPRLATLWEDTSRSIRKIRDGADLADMTFEKHLFWRNPDFYNGQRSSKLHKISFENVLVQLRTLRSKFEKLQNKIYE